MHPDEIRSGALQPVAGLFGISCLLIIAGQLAFCVGIYFVIPIIIAGNVVGYRRIFPRPRGGQIGSLPNIGNAGL